MASKMLKLFSPLTLGGKNKPVQLNHHGRDGDPHRSRDGVLRAAQHARRPPDRRSRQHQPHCSRLLPAPGLYTPEQVEGWKKVTCVVHEKEGKIFVQLWHSGRVGHTLNQPNGEQPVSSSARPFEDATSVAVTREGRRPYSVPRPLKTHEIPRVVADYKRAAENAMEAGFDGVELHGANGYLLEQFLCDSVNDRTDEYGGSIENRARLTLEALQAVLTSLDSSQVAIRVSPFGDTFGCTDSTPEETYSYLIKQLSPLNLAYLHIVEPRGVHPTAQNVPEGGTTKFSRKLYDGVLMTSSGYDRAEGIDVTESGQADCVAYGRPFISNPDLVHRMELDAPWNACDYKTFYPQPNAPMSAGYTDYPALELKANVAEAAKA